MSYLMSHGQGELKLVPLCWLYKSHTKTGYVGPLGDDWWLYLYPNWIEALQADYIVMLGPAGTKPKKLTTLLKKILKEEGIEFLVGHLGLAHLVIMTVLWERTPRMKVYLSIKPPKEYTSFNEEYQYA